MIRILLKIAIGLLLSGCTVNNFHAGSFSPTSVFLNSTETTTIASNQPAQKVVETATQHGLTQARIRPECGPYVPLPIPRPKQIDFKELDAATTGKEINAIALQNVKDLHQQINIYAARQQKHYGEYLARCVVKER